MILVQDRLHGGFFVYRFLIQTYCTHDGEHEQGEDP